MGVPLLVHWVLSGFAGYFVGMFAGTAFAKGTDGQRSTWGLVALGFLVGFLIGMSESPLIAGTLTGGFTLAGTLVGKLWDAPDSAKPPTFVVVGAAHPPNVIAPPPPAATSAKLGKVSLLALCGAAMVGVVLGVTVRANRVLIFRDLTLDAQLLEAGFTPEETREIHQRWVKSIGYADVIKPSPFVVSGVQGARVETPDTKGPTPAPPETGPLGPKFDWFAFWRDMDTTRGSPTDVLEALGRARHVPSAVREMVGRAKTAGRKDEDIVRSLRALTED